MKTKEETRLARNASSRKYYANHRKERLAHNAAWMKENEGYRKRYTKTHRERKTAIARHRFIFKSKKNDPYHRNYKGMPFFDAWNPDKGGSFDAAESWIIKNLGRRPEKATLHIVDHVLGFVPGNIEWTHPRKQINQQMHKVIAQQRNKIKKLEERIKELEGAQ
jgi:hypothetical protein